MIRSFLFSILSIICSLPVLGQYTSYSPYSRYGLGEISEKHLGVQHSMGGTGIATDHFYNLNLSNPASYSSLLLTTYEVGATSKFTRFYESNTPDSIKNKASISAFNFMALALPLGKRGGLAFGLTPYSATGYNINTKEEIDGLGTVSYNYRGNGGINSAFLGFGYKVYKDTSKYLSIGANANFLFGTITNEQRIIFDNSLQNYNVLGTKELQAKGFTFNYGLQYHHNITAKHSIAVGGTYGMSNEINASEAFIAGRYTVNSEGEESYKDTLLLSSLDGKLTLPSSFGVGLCFGTRTKPGNGDNFKLAFDYKIQNWQQFQKFGITDNLGKSERMSLGVSYLAGKEMSGANSKVSRFFNYTQYRGGIYYNKTYLQINGTQLNDYGISVGIGLPLKRLNSTVNVSAMFGERGTIQNNLVKERYANILLNFTLNDLWFIKRKVD